MNLMLLSITPPRYFYRSVEIHFPRFSISGSYALDQILPKLGFQDLFSQQANFSGITTQRKLQVSKVSHQGHQTCGLPWRNFCLLEAAGWWVLSLT
jgi:hypothetical protein